MNRIRELRLEKNMTQQDVAGLLNVKRQSVARYEAGLIDLDTNTIGRLCVIFGVTADYLLCLSAQRTSEITDADAKLVAAYHAAPESVREGINALLAPYLQKERQNAAAG